MFMGYIASSIYLLEHATWSRTRGEPELEVDAEVFRRWVFDGGFAAVEQELDRARSEHKLANASNTVIVFGHAKL